MAQWRHWLCAAGLIVAASACRSNERATSGVRPKPIFVPRPVQPLTRSGFHAFVVAAGSSVPEPGTDPARAIDPKESQRFIDQLCGGEPPPLFVALLAYPRQAASYEALFDTVEARCRIDPVALNRARGEAAWSMTGNQLALDRMLAPDADAVAKFCRTLDATSDLTSKAIAAAATGVGLVPEAAQNLVELAVSFVIQACPNLLDAIRK
jgi:hypothetical protein